MNLKNPQTAAELYEYIGPLGQELIGDKQLSVSSFTGPKEAETSGLIFINHPKYLKDAYDSAALCVIAPTKLKEQITENPAGKTWLLSPNPDLAAREIKKQFVLATPYRHAGEGIHNTAIIHSTAEIGEGTVVGPNAVIAENVSIGKNSFVGANAVIEANVKIKSNTTIHPLAYIGHSCEIGNNCEVMPNSVIGSEGYGYAHDHLGNHYRIPHTGKVVLEDDVHIGAASAIDRGTIEDSVIGKGTKIDNHVHLAHNSRVGKNGLITAHVVMAGSTTIGDNFICGGNSSITGHIEITDNVNLAGFTGVSNSIREPGQYGGYPLVPLKQHLKVKASVKQLPEIRKQLSKVLRKLFPEDYQQN